MVQQRTIQSLSDLIPRDEFTEQIEDILGDVSWYLDEGFYIEVTINPRRVSTVNPEDIIKEKVDNGYGLVCYIDKECTYEEFLTIFGADLLRDGSMTLAVIPCSESFFKKYREVSVPISIELNAVRGGIA